MIETIRQGLKAGGIHVSISKLCQWFDVPRRTACYQPTKAGTEGRCPVRRADQGDARGGVGLRLLHRGGPGRVQNKYGSADLAVQGLVGEEASGEFSPKGAGAPAGGPDAK